MLSPVVDVEAGVFPGEEVGKFAGADEFGVAEGVEEAVAEEIDCGREIFGGHAVEAAIRGEETVGSEEMEVGVEDEVVAEGVEGGDGSDAALGEVEAGAEGVLKGGGGGVEEVGEEAAAFAKDAAQDLGDGEDELAVGDFVADGGGDPPAGGADTALVGLGNRFVGEAPGAAVGPDRRAGKRGLRRAAGLNCGAFERTGLELRKSLILSP